MKIHPANFILTFLICACEKKAPETHNTNIESNQQIGPLTPKTETIKKPPATEESNSRTRPIHRQKPRDYPKPKLSAYPTAESVSEKAGFVTSPYSGKIINVKGIPPGTLVQDPTYPSSEKKYFRTPPAPSE